MKKKTEELALNRREFLRSGSLSSLMMLMGGVELTAQQTAAPAEGETQYKTVGDPVNCALIGCGFWGREILSTLGRLPNAPVVALCDRYSPYLRRAKQSAPEAETYEDYRKLLEQKDVQAVFVATPTHLHREIVLAALDAGKHVYCEAPLASSLEDARVIALAAKNSPKLYFQSGLQNRSDPQLHYVVEFIRTAAMGRMVKIHSQWHKKNSWRRASPNADFERALNWRLRNETSTGLIGEIGIHQVDLASWYLLSLPQAVTGFGSVVLWNDGRETPDTIDTVFEYPNGIRMVYDCTLANSFDGEVDKYFGTFGTIMLRERKAWMFKEVDSPLLGWEVYARKEGFYKETGIVLGANATKLAAQGDNPALDATSADNKTPLYYALEAFVGNVNTVSAGVEDFSALFDPSDTDALREYLATLTLLPAAGFKEGYEATATVIGANDAVLNKKRIAFSPELFAFA